MVWDQGVFETMPIKVSQMIFGKVKKKSYYERHKEERKEKSKEWRLDHPEESKKISRRYCSNNKEKVNQRNRKWRKENPEKLKASVENWMRSHMEKKRQSARKWHKKNPEKVKRINSEWKEKNPEAWKAMQRRGRRKSRFKRRSLGFIPLNEPFEGAHGHHIDKEHIVYIPAKLHRSVSHNVFTGEGMDEINDKVFVWLGLSMLSNKEVEK